MRHDAGRVRVVPFMRRGRRAMGQRDESIVRIGRIVEEDGRLEMLASRMPAGMTDEVGLAEGQIAGVVQETQSQARGGFEPGA